MELAHMLRAARADKGWTLREMGQHSGLDANHYSKFENGKKTPKMDTLLTLINVLDLDRESALLAWANAKADEAGRELLGE